MDTTAIIQHRGHCQHCGREQAVLRGHMAKHGYTVESGWFKGECGGHRYAPIETERAEADVLIASVQADVARLRSHVRSLQQGKTTPPYVVLAATPEPGSQMRMVAYADASAEQQRGALAKDIRDGTTHADDGERFAASLLAICDHFHGRSLRQVERLPAPPALLVGERRQAPSGTLTLTTLYRDRVAWCDDNSRSGTMPVRSWRRLPLVLREPQQA
ncbi:hypothetical protein [Xanthomonas perforans]|uniref:hypothetical protein n=1 Tax=Xanthomonas perforans TaxID=442694 RepID=UPI0023585318|nr:hypothetical protein [Xanthomonas perforans]MDC9654373.1 hypothetical protein [Xanthomonas perforans]MEB2158945.1 hypothetical protein [Xanthomonas campestris pv. campestris]